MSKRNKRQVRRAALGVGLVLVALVVSGAAISVPTAAHAQDDGGTGDNGTPSLAFFTPVQGELDNATPLEQYTFDGYAGQVVSVIAQTLAGDLDPVVQIIGPNGDVAGENDDLDTLVRDAGLEAFALPEDGTYTVRVMRYQGVNGTTSGTYELTLTPGLGQFEWREAFDSGALSWITPQGEALPLSSGGLRLRINEPDESLRAFPPDAPVYENLYMQADIRLFGIVPYAEFGLVLRAQGVDLGAAYIIKLNTDGEWSLVLQDNGEFVLRSWEANPALDADEWRIAVMVRGNRFDVFANDAHLGTLIDGRLDEQGTIGLYAASAPEQAEDVTVIFDDILLTTRLGTTYSGLPLALENWNAADPAEIVAELSDSGQIATPAATHDLFLTDKTLEATDPDAVFELVGTDQALYDDFVLGSRVSALTEGDGAGCGLVYRWQDARNLDLAYVDTAGGFGVVQARDGELTTNVYDFSPMVGIDATKLLVLVRGDQIALYVNGALVTQERVEPGAGRAGVALLNYEDLPATCLWTDVWVWPLLDAESGTDTGDDVADATE